MRAVVNEHLSTAKFCILSIGIACVQNVTLQGLYFAALQQRSRKHLFYSRFQNNCLTKDDQENIAQKS